MRRSRVRLAIVTGIIMALVFTSAAVVAETEGSLLKWVKVTIGGQKATGANPAVEIGGRVYVDVALLSDLGVSYAVGSDGSLDLARAGAARKQSNGTVSAELNSISFASRLQDSKYPSLGSSAKSGHVFLIANLTFTNGGKEELLLSRDLFHIVAPGAAYVQEIGDTLYLQDALPREVALGKSVTGNVVVQIPEGLADAQLVAQFGFLGTGYAIWPLSGQLVGATEPVTTGSSKSQIKPGAKLTATVTRVVDGDTIEVKLASGGTERVRLIGMDTPEVYGSVEPYGKEASDFTKGRLSVGKQITLELDVEVRDRYQRLLAYVFVGTELLNETIVQEGYALVYTYPPNVKYVSRFAAAQTRARESKRGLWNSATSDDETKTAPSTSSSSSSGGSADSKTPGSSSASPSGESSVQPASELIITTHPGTVRRNGTARVAVQTAAGVSCSIVVTYKSGPSSASGLSSKTTDSQGNASWSWRVGSNTTPGTWPVSITCGGQTVETSVTVP